MGAVEKHLVLEPDIHKALKTEKGLTGLSIKEIGNAILRTTLEESHMVDLIGSLLVSTGKLSEDEVQQVLKQARLGTKRTRTASAPPVSRTRAGTLISGSWEIANIVSSDDKLYQILECWARDSDRQPMDAHSHKSDEYIIVLKGRVSLTMGGKQFVLCPQNMIQIPADCIHAATPLDASSYLITVLSPAVPEYHIDSASA